MLRMTSKVVIISMNNRRQYDYFTNFETLFEKSHESINTGQMKQMMTTVNFFFHRVYFQIEFYRKF